MKQHTRRARNRLSVAGAPGQEVSSSHRAEPGEATLIAGVTAVAYMVALAYRVGGLMRLKLPLSLATVRVTDAAIAGLVVLIGGSLTFLFVDLVESWRAGTLSRLWIALVSAAMSGFLLLTAAFLLVFLFVVWSYAGALWTAVLASVMVAGFWILLSGLRRALAVVVAPTGNGLVLTQALENHPAFAGSLLLAFALCAGAFCFGVSAVSFGHPSYLRTTTTSEIALSLSEDRVILAGIEPTASDEATLTGSVRVVPLPSSEVVFSAQCIRDLHPAPR